MDYRAGVILAAVSSSKSMTLADLLNYYDWSTWDELPWEVLRDCGDVLMQTGLMEVRGGRMAATGAGRELLVQYADREDPNELGRAIWNAPKVASAASLPFTEGDVRRALRANKIAGLGIWLLLIGGAGVVIAALVWLWPANG